MEISAAAASSPPAKPPLLLLRPVAAVSSLATSSSTTVRRRTSGSATTTVRRRARARPRTGRRSEPPSDGGEYFSGDEGIGSGGYSGGGAAGVLELEQRVRVRVGPADWEPTSRPAPRSAAEAALGVVYELMCLIALSNCTQFAVRRLAGLLAARVAALRFVPTVC
ncbi:hypothetical protein PR202_gb20393 [Eleusine coracana subsp. coracana]|uniref:Uncharacterized protein n=1 Tax=Eleusine coracana subsp. coracana TaxID=191504 RepID=A0AAV5FAK2_ELECO|nr:hypothetical protein PR202_gb20393 [Eleusine coracana subsp. coracana]